MMHERNIPQHARNVRKVNASIAQSPLKQQSRHLRAGMANWDDEMQVPMMSEKLHLMHRVQPAEFDGRIMLLCQLDEMQLC